MDPQDEMLKTYVPVSCFILFLIQCASRKTVENIGINPQQLTDSNVAQNNKKSVASDWRDSDLNIQTFLNVTGEDENYYSTKKVFFFGIK